MSRHSLTSLALGLLACNVFACGDDDGVLPDASMPDAETDAGDMMDAALDADLPVFGAPFVVQVLPSPGDEMVEAETSLLIVFSEQMTTSGGTILLQPGEISLDASGGTWISGMELGSDELPDDIAVLVEVPETLTGGVEYTAFVQRDFTDLEGNALDEIYDWTFKVVDLEPPTVIATTPAEGATGISAAGTTEIRIEFSEQMQPTGTATLRGPGTLGEPRWEPSAVTYPVTGLVYDVTYAVELSDFVDEAGLALDTETYLGDGEIDFSTGEDVDPPFVVTSTPVEGMRGVNPALRTIRLDFNEAMRADVDTTAVFSDGTVSTPLSGSWVDDRTIQYDVGGLVAATGPHVLDLTGSTFEDREGNPLDRTTYLVDGAVDFEVGEDTFSPKVVLATPEEGETGVSFSLTRVVVRFDEPMNPTVGSALLIDGATTTPLGAIWSVGDTVAEFSIAGRIRAGSAYGLDLSSFEDVGGNVLDTVFYLGDGILDFTTEDASGDSCLDPLNTLQAETVDGALLWRLPGNDFVDHGATDVCDADSSGASDDVVIRYVKTSERLADGGAALDIDVRATGSDTTDINWALQEGCEPVLDADDERLLACHHEVQESGRVVDLPPGEYFIWVAKDSTGTFPGANVTVREVTALPEGESCAAPWTTSSVVYSPPAGADLPHLFEIPPSDVSDFDRVRASGDEGDFACGPNHGVDSVIRFDKSAGTVLQIRATPADIRSGASDLTVEVTRGCDATDPDLLSLACEDGFDRVTTFEASPPAGPVYIWITAEFSDDAFPGATVSIREIPVAEGEGCGSARALPGDGAVTLDSTRNLGAGSCFDDDVNVTWYSLTPSEAIAVLSSDLAGNIVIRDQTTDRELACTSDATTGTSVIVPGGSLCVGIQNDAALTNISVTEQTYSGLRGEITDPGYLRGLTSSGGEESWTSDLWMVTTPSTIYLGEGTFGTTVHQIPKPDGSRALFYGTSSGITSSTSAYGAATLGERLFTMDDTSSTSSNRLYEAWDAMSFPWSPTAWDTGARPYDSDARAMTLEPDGTQLLIATHDSSEVHFYNAPTAAPGDVVELGSNSNINDVRGIAADDTYIYLCGDIEMGGPEGLVRIPRTELSNPSYVPEVLAQVDVSSTACPVVIDDPNTPGQLYFRAVTFSSGNTIQVVVDPGGATPAHLGSILTLGGSGDYAMAYDRTESAMYLFETQTTSIGRIVRVQ